MSPQTNCRNRTSEKARRRKIEKIGHCRKYIFLFYSIFQNILTYLVVVAALNAVRKKQKENEKIAQGNFIFLFKIKAK